MIAGGLNWFLKLTLVGVFMPAFVRADDGRKLPQRLADTGLYVAGGTTIRPDVLPFSPQYPLWSDGAAKRRWIWLPPGTPLFHGSAQIRTRCRMVAGSPIQYARANPPSNSAKPVRTNAT